MIWIVSFESSATGVQLSRFGPFARDELRAAVGRWPVVHPTHQLLYVLNGGEPDLGPAGEVLVSGGSLVTHWYAQLEALVDLKGAIR